MIDNIVKLNVNLKEILSLQEYTHKLANFYVEKTNKKIVRNSITETLVLKQLKSKHVLEENEKLIKLDNNNIAFDKMSQIVKDIHVDIYNAEVCSDERALEIANIYLKKGLYILTDDKEEKIFCHAVVVRKQINGCAIGAVISPREYRGKGYGKKCIYSLCKKLLEEGNKYIVLHVGPQNYAAKKVYESIGFEIFDTTEKFVFE